MSPSERVLAGFALAATIAKDPGAGAARAGLCDSVVDALTHTARELSQLGKAERRARIRALTAVPAPNLVTGHPRALALLAHRRGADTTPGRSPLPLPRPGYQPPALLVALLARIAARSQKAAE